MVRIAFIILRFCRERISSTQLATLAVLADPELTDQDQDLRILRAQAADLEAYLMEICKHIVRAANDAIGFSHFSAKDMFSTDLESFSPHNRQVMPCFIVSTSDGHAILYRLCMKTIQIEARNPEV